MDRLLRRLQQQGTISALDYHFALLLYRLDGRDAPELGLAAALASNSSGEGHVCLQLSELAGKTLFSAVGEPLQPLPSLPDWREVLTESPVVGRPGDYSPLILDKRDRLYLHRFWCYESKLAVALQQLADCWIAVDQTQLQRMLDQLFPPAVAGETDWQRVAASTALQRQLTVISGGPGTGKTSTVVRILALLRQQPGGDALRIALAAPTGKAAARMQESIEGACQTLPLAAELLGSLPKQASTLHRLLGVQPGSSEFRHNKQNPLPLDLLIVDEASMIDIALMARLLQALPTHARLILLGDRDQLASVEAGAVLGDICAGAGQQTNPLAQSIVLLQRSYRFSEDSDIGQLAKAINSGDAEQVISLLQTKEQSGIDRLENPEALLDRAVTCYADYLQQVAAGCSVAGLVTLLNRFRVLCARLNGPLGVTGLNREIEKRLRQRGLISGAETWYPGRPVMITRNDYNLHLYNGDLGIALPDETKSGRLALFFPAADGGVRKLALARLPEHETVYAMTVHKSQGSEFEQVALVLPGEDSPLLTREMLYTGITRARESVSLLASDGILQQAVKRRLVRHSGLMERLWQAADS